MIVFILAATLLLLLALAFLLPALLAPVTTDVASDDDRLIRTLKSNLGKLKKHHDAGVLPAIDYEQLKAQQAAALVSALETRELQPQGATPGKLSKAAAVVVILALPLAATLLYRHLGAPELLLSPAQSAANAKASMPEMIAQLKQRLTSEPDNAEGWFMLSRAYMSEQQYQQGADAMANVYRIVGEDPTVMVQYADALAMANNGSMMGKPAELLAKTLQINPNLPEALWLSGIAAGEQNNFEAAIAFWERARPLLADDENSAKMLDEAIADARARLTQSGATASPAASSAATDAEAPQPVAAPSASVTIKVSLDQAIADTVKPSDSVFVFARAASGPPMPLAATRVTVAELPLTVTLDDSMAMTPQMMLSSFKQIVVGARVSRSGQATPQSGDIEGISDPLEPGSRTDPVGIVINTVRP